MLRYELKWQRCCFHTKLSMAKNKFKIDDVLEVVNYGFLIYQPKDEPNANGYDIYNQDDEGYTVDIYPEWIGLTGRVIEIHDTPKGKKYSLSTPVISLPEATEKSIPKKISPATGVNGVLASSLDPAP